MPRAHLRSDILSLDKADYSQLLEAAHTVAQILKRSFGAKQVGMIFEGFEIDYAHVKLIPIRSSSNTSGSLQTKSLIYQGEYHEKCPGYVSSLQGPLARDPYDFFSSTETISKILQRKRREAPESWLSPAKCTLD